jgi:hypothetical protein
LLNISKKSIKGKTMLSEEEAREEIIKLVTDWEKYNLRVGQIFDQAFEKVKADGKEPFAIEDNELLEYIKQAYKGIC